MSLKEAQNKHYRQRKSDWETARRMYTGDFSPESLLPRGPYESKLAYEKRVKIADFHRHTALLIGRLSGSLMQRESEVERTLGTLTEDLLASVGPDGESYRQQLSVLADSLLLYNEVWLWVRPAGAGAELHVVNPLQVPRWKDGEVLMLGTRSKEASLFEPEETQTTYTRHLPGGWETYILEENEAGKTKRKQIDSGTYGPDGKGFFVDEDGNPAPPIFRVQMPWDSPFGLTVAQSHAQLYRMRNELDMGSTAGLNSSMATVTGVDSDGEDKVVDGLKDGEQLIFLPEDASMDPFELATGNIEAAEKRLENKREDFYRTAYQSLEEASQSATGRAIEHSQGPAAALSQLAGASESAEESVLRFLEQATNIVDFGGPNPQPSDISVEWPRDYQTIELEGGEAPAEE